MEMRSVPVKANGQDTDCVGVGAAKPSLDSFCWQAALKGLFEKSTTGTGSCPLNSTACSLAKAAKVVASARSGCGSAAGFENESLRGFGVRSFCFFKALRAARSSGVSFLRFLDFFLSSLDELEELSLLELLDLDELEELLEEELDELLDFSTSLSASLKASISANA